MVVEDDVEDIVRWLLAARSLTRTLQTHNVKSGKRLKVWNEVGSESRIFLGMPDYMFEEHKCRGSRREGWLNHRILPRAFSKKYDTTEHTHANLLVRISEARMNGAIFELISSG